MYKATPNPNFRLTPTFNPTLGNLFLGLLESFFDSPQVSARLIPPTEPPTQPAIVYLPTHPSTHPYSSGPTLLP